MSQDIGEKMKKIRIARNMTQNDIADAMGVSRQYISRWESGERNIKFEQLVEFAKVVGVTLDYFTDNSPERTLFQLMAQLESVFSSAAIPESDKDKAYQDIMKIYLRSKEMTTENNNPSPSAESLLDLKEE